MMIDILFIIELNINMDELKKEINKDVIISRWDEIAEAQALMHTLRTEMLEKRDFIKHMSNLFQRIDKGEDVWTYEEDDLTFKRKMLDASIKRSEELKPQIEYADDKFFKLFN